MASSGVHPSIPIEFCAAKCMRSAGIFAVIVSAFGIVGCETVVTDHDQPARIVDPDSASRAALQRAVDLALGTHVTLSDTALTDRSVLTIENWPTPTMENPVPQGRAITMPIQFRLVKNGEQCILVRQSDRSRYVLDNTTCAPE